jgi:hypothetical protein
MSDDSHEKPPTQYAWHHPIGTVYQGVIERLQQRWLEKTWLGARINTASLKNAAKKGKPDVTTPTPDSIAGQFLVNMPSHSHKVEFALDQLLENDCLLPLITKNSYLAIVDIGCGGGAASTAVINAILKRQKAEMNVLFTGVEVDEHAIQLYDWMMLSCESALPSAISMGSRAIFKGLPEALTYVAEGLEQARLKWQIPYLSDLWVIQSNVVRPLANQHTDDIKTRRKLELSGERGLIPDDFGVVIARAYQQLLQLTEADRMLMITVATWDSPDRNGAERDQEQRERAETLTAAIHTTFSEKGYDVKCPLPIQAAEVPLNVVHENPVGGFGLKHRK